jgi:hypothetical protein
MTPFHPQQSARGRSDRQTATDDTLQIHVANCNKKLHARIHETRIIWCNNWQGAGQAYAAELKFYARQAVPLRNRRILRLAKSSPMAARSPARWQRDGRAISGKIAGKMSRGIAAQLPGNGRALAAAMPPNVRQDDSQDSLPCTGLGRHVRTGNLRDDSQLGRATTAQLPGNGRALAAAMPPNVRQDDLQDNLPCAGLGRAMTALETCETTRNLAARQPRQHLTSSSSDSRRQLLSMTIQRP